jgi:hypothetical protein
MIDEWRFVRPEAIAIAHCLLEDQRLAIVIPYLVKDGEEVNHRNV